MNNKTKWILQDNIHKDDIYKMVRIMQENDIPYETVTVIPFDNNPLVTAPYNGPVIVYGSTSLIKNVPQSWVWFDQETFKPSYWGNYIKEYYLNYDMEVLPLEEACSYILKFSSERFFVRPNSDLKLFSGEVFMRGDFLDWYERIKKLIETGTYVNINMDTEICISPYKALLKEWRFFIIGQDVVAFSQYRENGQLHKSKDFDPHAYELARKIAKIGKWFELAPGYVLDIALTKDGAYEVIEFNNFNSSGFYMCDLYWIIKYASRHAEILWNNSENKEKEK